MGAAAVDVWKTAAKQGSRQPKMTARSVFRTVHLAVGLSFGLLLVSQGLSGAALVWRPELDRWMLPTLSHTAATPTDSKPSLDAELAAVKTAAHDGRVRALRLPVRADGTDEWNVQMPAPDGAAKGSDGPRWTVYTSPANGQVLGIRGAKRDALQFLIELHHNLLWGKTGRAIQGYLAIATILLALSGLWLWWPARWTPSRFRPRAAARPLHYAIGFWAMWPLLTIATTATYFIWRQPIQQAFGVADKQGTGNRDQGSGNREQAAGEQGRRGEHAHGPDQGGNATDHRVVPAYSLDAVVEAARAAQPTAKLTMVRFPDGKAAPFTVMFEAADENYRAAPNSMTVRPAQDGTAQVEKVSMWRDLPRAKRFLEWLPRVHQGEFGGVLIRLIWSLTGLMPAVLYVSGFLMWRRRLAAGQ